MYVLQLTHDRLAPNARPDLLPTQHAIFYVCGGSITVNGSALAPDQAFYAEDQAVLRAGPQGADLWRWEVVPEAKARAPLRGEGVETSIVRMVRQVKMLELVPTSNWLFRLDCIQNLQGSTGLHSHPGSGIRCLLDGELKVESQKGESSSSSAKGDSWYEEGAYPLVTTVPSGATATFLRGLIFPPEFETCERPAYWLEGVPAARAGWKNYCQTLITLR
jgi:hypothetical protein